MKEKPIWEQPGYDFDPPYPASTPVITNYDRLISKTPEELAEWLDDNDSNFPISDGGAHWLSWLKSPVEVDNGETD